MATTINFNVPVIALKSNRKKGEPRVCPDCGAVFQKAKRIDGMPTCPGCGVELYFPSGKMKGMTLLRQDVEAVDYIVDKVQRNAMALQGVKANGGSFGGSEGERLMGYDLLFKCKAFLYSQKEQLNISYHDFAMGVIDFILTDRWWREHLESIRMVKNKILNFIGSYYKKLVTEVYHINMQASAVQVAESYGFDVMVMG